MPDFSESDLELVVPKLKQIVNSLKDEVAKSELSKFIDSWPGEVHNGHARDAMFGAGK